MYLKPIHRYKRVTPYPHEMVHRRQKIQGKTCEDDDDGDKVWQYSTVNTQDVNFV